MSERRHFPRTLDRAAVVIELLSVPGHPEMSGSAYECHTADISEGGVRLAGYAALPVGSDALLLIATTDGEKLQIRGRISWQLQVATPAAFFTGVEFVRMSSATTKRWRAYVDRCIRNNKRRLQT